MVGQNQALTLTAYDVTGNVVLAPLTFDVESANTGVAAISVGGDPANVKGAGAGTALITVTETESGKTAVTTVTVAGGH